MGKIIEFVYRNWRGEVSTRRVVPLHLNHGATEWHPEPQWLLIAFDVEKDAERSFALRDINPYVDGWIVTSGDGERFRCWRDGMAAWTIDREKATRYARREDAEAVHLHDEDAWSILPLMPATDERVVLVPADAAELLKYLRWAAVPGSPGFHPSLVDLLAKIDRKASLIGGDQP